MVDHGLEEVAKDGNCHTHYLEGVFCQEFGCQQDAAAEDLSEDGDGVALLEVPEGHEGEEEGEEEGSGDVPDGVGSEDEEQVDELLDQLHSLLDGHRFK